jgi:hypothetical protein
VRRPVPGRDDQVGEVAAARVGVVVAERGLRGGVPSNDATGGVDRDVRVRRGGEDGLGLSDLFATADRCRI